MPVVSILLALLVFFAHSFSLNLEGISYRPGRGLRIEPIKSTVGGYITGIYKKRKNYEEITLDDVAILIFGKPARRFRYFVGFELNEFYKKVNGKEETNKKIDVERLYLDFEISEPLKVRVGRFITPVGLWNPVHINVLKWTTSDPLTATEFFPKFTTGIQLFGNLPKDFSYALFFQSNKGISESYNNFFTRKVVGGELKKEFSENLRLGLNAGWFEIEDPKEEITFFGFSALYKVRKTELSGEFMYGIEEEKYVPEETHWSYRLSYYLQAVRRVFKGNYAVVRYGYFKDKSDKEVYRIWTFGWNFRPVYYVALKAEYQIREESKFNTFLASFSWTF